MSSTIPIHFNFFLPFAFPYLTLLGHSFIRHNSLHNVLVVDVLSVKMYAHELLLKCLPESADVLCTHPMFGPESGGDSWTDLPFVYDIVRVNPSRKSVCAQFLDIWKSEGCRMVEMSCSEHDEFAASTQFITHTTGMSSPHTSFACVGLIFDFTDLTFLFSFFFLLFLFFITGRMLSELSVESTPINTRGYESLLGVVDTTCKDSFELFYGLFKYNPKARSQLDRLEDALRNIREQLETTERKNEIDRK